MFGGSIAALYDTCLVPLIFEPYAHDVAARLAARDAARVLEVAAGTGAVTRALVSTLPADVEIVATDLNQAMLDQAMRAGTARPVAWRQADAMNLPFADGEFDVVVCQFGAMFFPDRAKAFAEARRVLSPGGALIFSVWDRIEVNDFAHVVTASLEAQFPDDPPRFLARTPYGYADRDTIAGDVARAGFARSPVIDTVSARSRADSPHVPALGFCQGTPLRGEIEARDASRLGEATDMAAEAIAKRFGGGAVDGGIQAHVVTAQR